MGRLSQGYSARRALSSASINVRQVWIPLSSERKPKMELNRRLLFSSQNRINPLPARRFPCMKAILLPTLLLFVLSTVSRAQTCREVVRDASGRVVQTIDRQKQSGSTERAVIRDASGRIIGTATTQVSAGGGGQTTFRDAHGRATGSATTQGSSSGSFRTTYRDANGRTTGSATSNNFSGSGSRTQYRDASGRLTGNQTTTNVSPSGSFSGTRRDASGRLVSSSSGSGKCQGAARAPMPTSRAR